MEAIFPKIDIRQGLQSRSGLFREPQRWRSRRSLSEARNRQQGLKGSHPCISVPARRSESGGESSVVPILSAPYAMKHTEHRVIHAPRGTTLSCKGWIQEAALRMIHNNLDPDVAERPDDLIVYGGTGKAARSWEAFDRIVAALRALENDETLLVQSGKPAGIFRTHAHAPRVLIANSNLVP